jgi:uncharacterized membrane protein
METPGLFTHLPLWGVFVLTLVIVLVSVELGYRRARARQQRATAEHEQEREAPVGAMVGATLGLLAFLLAFTFGMAAEAFHARRVAVLDEANAIQTAHLRAATLAEPQRTQVRRLLREYVEERLAWGGVKASVRPPPSKDLLDALWAHAATEAERNPTDITGLFVEAVNEVFDLHAERILVRERSHVPGALWLILYLIAVLSMAAMGYHGGVAGTTRSPVMVAVAVTFSLVMLLVADLDREGEGWINAGQEAMVDLERVLSDSH